MCYQRGQQAAALIGQTEFVRIRLEIDLQGMRHSFPPHPQLRYVFQSGCFGTSCRKVRSQGRRLFQIVVSKDKISPRESPKSVPTLRDSFHSISKPKGFLGMIPVPIVHWSSPAESFRISQPIINSTIVLRTFLRVSERRLSRLVITGFQLHRI